MANYKLIDLFAGAGGMSLGFSKAFNMPFESVWANDFNQHACNTYNINLGNHCVCGDINQIINSGFEIPQADVVIGGPPCQGFSLLNKFREGDIRKQMWYPFLQIVEMSGARVFVMENVPQLLGTEEHEAIMHSAQAMGFKLVWAKLMAADYGVPQKRQRAFIIGSKTHDPTYFFPPKKTNISPKLIEKSLGGLSLFDHTEHTLPPWRTVRDAIGDLPNPEGTEIRSDLGSPLNLHFGRKPTELSIQRYKAIPEEGMNRVDLLLRAPELTPDCWVRKKSGGTDLFGRLWWDRPSFTIRTEFFKPEKGRYLHPSEHRPITHREAARLQTFPDDFVFLGTKTEIARQIGNAVPPLLASKVAACVANLLSASNDKHGSSYSINATTVSPAATQHYSHA